MTIGYDSNGIRRVWGDNLENAIKAAEEYLTSRPDTGPLNEWHFIEKSEQETPPTGCSGKP